MIIAYPETMGEWLDGNVEGVEVGKAGKNGGAIPAGEIGLWPPGVNARLFLFASIAAAAAAAFFMADANLKMELQNVFNISKIKAS